MAGTRQPTDLVILKGKKHLTKAEIEERKEKEIVAPNDNVTAPKYLPKRLKDKFEEIASELVEIGIMANIDSDALARYLVANDRYEKISKELLKLIPIEDMKIEGELLKLQDRYFKQARLSANDLALTITSRCKLVMPKLQTEDKQKTKAEQRFGGRI